MEQITLVFSRNFQYFNETSSQKSLKKQTKMHTLAHENCAPPRDEAEHSFALISFYSSLLFFPLKARINLLTFLYFSTLNILDWQEIKLGQVRLVR